MFTVELYAKIRHAVMIDGLSRREAAKRFVVHRNSITKMLSFSVPPGYCRRERPTSKKLRALFLNATASPGVADFGFFGRGCWIDQPIAFKASQPRWGATDLRPSSPAIQAATLRLDHRPPSVADSPRRSRNFASSSGSRIVATAPLRWRKSPRASGPLAL